MHASPFLEQKHMTVETVIDTVRRQLNADCDVGLFALYPSGEMDLIAARSVESLWERSRIKAFIPLLALREAREQLRLAPHPDVSPAGVCGSVAHHDLMVDAMLHKVKGLIGLRLTLTRDNQWMAVLLQQDGRDTQGTACLIASGATMDDALTAVITQAKGTPRQHADVLAPRSQP
jgi:hypothetical protein